MINIPEKLRRDVLRAKEVLEKADKIFLIHHDDADGICSAALALVGIGESRVKRRVCLEKLFPEAINLIYSQVVENDVVVYVDLGSPHASKISKELKKGYSIIIDHHDPEIVENERIVHINPELYGLKGERDASASTMTYIVFKLMGKSVLEHSFLAVIGSAEIPGPLRSLNEIPLIDAEVDGKVKRYGGKYKERYYVNFHGLRKPHYIISSMLSTISSIGYYRGGPKYAVKACFEGFSNEIIKFHDEMKALKNMLFEKALETIRSGGLKIRRHMQWFSVGKLFYNVGVKTIGLFTSQLKYKSIVHQDKYILGFMEMNPEIPGLGRLPENLMKVSGRVPSVLEEKISSGEMPSIAEVMSYAAEKVGGFADGHMFAASGVIGKNAIEGFLELFDKMVDEKIGKKGLLKYFT